MIKSEKHIIKNIIAAVQDIEKLTHSYYVFLMCWCDFIAHYELNMFKQFYTNCQDEFKEDLLINNWILHHNRTEWDDDYADFEQAKYIYQSIIDRIRNSYQGELFDKEGI